MVNVKKVKKVGFWVVAIIVCVGIATFMPDDGFLEGVEQREFCKELDMRATKLETIDGKEYIQCCGIEINEDNSDFTEDCMIFEWDEVKK